MRQALVVGGHGVLLAEDIDIEIGGLVAPMFSLDIGLESKELNEQMLAALENEQ